MSKIITSSLFDMSDKILDRGGWLWDRGNKIKIRVAHHLQNVFSSALVFGVQYFHAINMPGKVTIMK